MRQPGGGMSGAYAVIDLGTARTRSLVSDGPAITDRPSSAPHRASDPADAGVLAEPGLVWPVRHGMVADMAACARLVRAVMRDAARDGARPPERVLVGVPVAASDLDRRAARAAVGSVAGCPVSLVEEPLAAAVGSGLDVTGPRPRLLIDVGAGIVEAVVIRDAGVADAGAVQITLRSSAGLPGHDLERVVAMVGDLIGRLPAGDRAAARAGVRLTGGGAAHPELAQRLRTALRVTATPAREPAHATVKGLATLGRLVAHPNITE